MKNYSAANLIIVSILTAAYIFLNILCHRDSNLFVSRLPASVSQLSSSNSQISIPDSQLTSANLQPLAFSSRLPTLFDADVEKNTQNNLQLSSDSYQLSANNNEVFIKVEEYPSFPGGDKARLKFLQQNIHYPSEALSRHLEGKVIISFIVEKDGTISNLKVLNGIGGGCDDEALRVAGLMPKWNPGEQSGVPVRVSFNMPISFRLQLKNNKL